MVSSSLYIKGDKNSYANTGGFQSVWKISQSHGIPLSNTNLDIHQANGLTIVVTCKHDGIVATVQKVNKSSISFRFVQMKNTSSKNLSHRNTHFISFLHINGGLPFSSTHFQELCIKSLQIK